MQTVQKQCGTIQRRRIRSCCLCERKRYKKNFYPLNVLYYKDIKDDKRCQWPWQRSQDGTQRARRERASFSEKIDMSYHL